MKLLDGIKEAVRSVMRVIARTLNNISGGRISPTMITLVGLISHLPIAWLILLGSKYNGYLVVAGVLLIVFGLFDTLDGELARLQKRTSPAGMFLDSVTDRIKEVLVYLGIIANLAATTVHGDLSEFDAIMIFVLVSVVAVLAGSLLISYINAWGEAVLARAGANKSVMNKTFRGGLASFEVRITLLAVGLLTTHFLAAVWLIGILVIITLVQRLTKVFRELSRVQG